MAFYVTAGTMYAVGFDKPFFVSEARVREGLQDAGFSNVTVMDRGRFEATQPLNVASLPGYDDDWDTAVMGVAVGSRLLEPPVAFAWVIELRPEAPPAMVPQAPAPPSGPVPTQIAFDTMPAPPLVSERSGGGKGLGLLPLFVIAAGTAGVIWWWQNR